MAAEGEEQVEEKVPVPPLDEEQTEDRRRAWGEIFADYPANKIKLASVEERKASEKAEDLSLTYGELDFSIVNNLITMLKGQHTRLYAGQGIFLDLGSGCGKACVAAALAHPFEKVVGIETLACLDEAAQKSNDKYKEAALAGDPPPEKAPIEFIKGDFVADLAEKLEPLAPQIAVAVAVASCYGEQQMEAIAKLADKMADNAIFVTYSQVLPDWVIGGDKKLPNERYRDQLKVALAARGTDPAMIDIEKNPPDAKPGGWRLVHEEEVSMPNGGAPIDLPTKCFVFKRIPLPVVEQPPQEEGGEPAEDA